MPDEKRQKTRQSITYPGSIDAGDKSPLQPCTLHDVSDRGAKIATASPDKLPDRFTLILGYEGTVRRRCRVAWRSEKVIGVEFLKAPPPGSVKPAAPATKKPAPEKSPGAPASR